MDESAGIELNAPFPQPPAWAEHRKQLIVCSAAEMKEAGPTTGKAIELHEGGKLSALKTFWVGIFRCSKSTLFVLVLTAFRDW